MTTIKDIAKACKLSPTSVSLVLNSKPNRVSVKTKKIIFDTAKEMNYRPNQIAVSLATGRSNSLGLIIPDVSNLFFAEIALAIEKTASVHGYNVILGNTADSIIRESEYLDIMISRNVDGIIFVPAADEDRTHEQLVIEKINNCPVPIIFVDRSYPSNKCSSFSVDHELGSFLATNHLIQLGHSKIACLTGPSGHSNTELRLQGYIRALEENGLSFNSKYIFRGNYKISSGENYFDKILKTKATAIFSFNDMMAFGIYKEARNKNIRIPQDLSLIGFDDNDFCQIPETPLTTIFQPVKKIASKATNTLINSIAQNNNISKSVKFTPKLIVRQSTAHVKQVAT